MMEIYEKMKPFLCDFIQYYYNELGNGAGGFLHVATDDGNLDPECIWFCQEECTKNGDHFGFFIATIMRHFKTEELEEMYEDNWGMKV
jgi:hypothetical protein